MLLLMLFALVAGAGTALSPCVLPVLPAVLGAGATGGRRRPLGIVTGLVISFALATTAIASLLDALGFPDDFLRWAAIVTLAGFGALLLAPTLAARFEAFVQRLVPSAGRRGGDGFGSGLVVGASLGLLYVPCAGPILAAVIVGAASQDFTAGRLAVALAYAAGSGVALYALMLGGRRISERLSAYRGQIQAAIGVVMIAVAGLMAADLDVRFQDAIASDLPAFLVNPTEDIESSGAISDELAAVRGGHGTPEAGASEAATGGRLPDLGAAPQLADTQRWFNTPGDRPLSIADLTAEGHPVLIDFWTYTCINCIRTLPYVEAWYKRYRRDGLVVIGVHTPEFPFEREAGNVERAIADDGLTYPVVQDNAYGTWNAFGNQYWPAKYLIDAEGRLRYVHFGEGEYPTTEAAIRSVLAEARQAPLGRDIARPRAEVADPGVLTPESYLGAARAQNFVNGTIRAGATDYGRLDPAGLPPNALGYGGRWRISDESATAGRGANLALDFTARRVFLVLGSTDRPRRLGVELDGKPIPAALAGDDVAGGVAEVSRQRLYRLVDLPRSGRHLLTLHPAPGIEGYAFTFG
jgi:cytochrome c biogenesis protein CcdA/thiol-disulfide isomerase/thioredoxin